MQSQVTFQLQGRAVKLQTSEAILGTDNHVAKLHSFGILPETEKSV